MKSALWSSFVLCGIVSGSAVAQTPVRALAIDERQEDQYVWAVAGTKALAEYGDVVEEGLGFDPAARREIQEDLQALAALRLSALGVRTFRQRDPPAVSTAEQQPSPAATSEVEVVFWQSIANSTNPAEFEAYLSQFPNGVFRALAEVRLAALRSAANDPPTAAVRPAGGGLGSSASASRVPEVNALPRVAADVDVGELDVGRLRLMAEEGNASAQRELGGRYEEGRGGVVRDYRAAVSWFRRAADQGYPPAQTAVGYMLSQGRGVEQNDAEAARWYRRAAEQGHPRGQNNLGVMYADGLGVPRDDEEAVRWYRRAAEQGHATGQYNLGWMYANGRGVRRNEEEAVRWYRRAAEQGHPGGQNNLGVMYADGLGVPRDDEEVVRWYRRAAEQGHATGQYNLGWMYANGRGVRRNEEEAVRWYRRAAEQGHARAQFNLGLMYERGRGVRRDRVEAARWYSRAAEQGYDEARKRLDDLR